MWREDSTKGRYRRHHDAEAKPETGPARPSFGIGHLERLLVLRTFAPFAELSAEELNVVAEYSNERYFPGQTYISYEGHPVRAIQFIVRGRVVLRRGGQTIRVLGPRSAVGGLGVFAREPEGYDGIAEDDTTTLEISAEDMFDILEDHFALLRATLRAIAQETLATRRRLGGHAAFEQHVRAAPHECPSRPLDLVERMAFLRRTLSFAHRQLEALADLARESTEMRLATGECLWTQGDTADHVVIPIWGAVECEAPEVSWRFRLGAGDVVGGLDALAEEPRWCTVTAVEPVVALRIEMETLHDLFEDNFEMALEFLQLVASRLLSLYEFETGRERLAAQ